MKITYILVIILLVIILLLYNKKENFIVGNEAISNIASVYADVSGTATFNNVRTNDIKTNDIRTNNLNILDKFDASGTSTFNNIRTNNLRTNNLNISNNLDISGNLNILGKIYKKDDNMVRYIRVGNKLTSGINSEAYWTIHEVEVYDLSANNIARNKPVTVISGRTEYPNDNNWGSPSNITNGNATISDSDYYHGNASKDHELEIDLGQLYSIGQIIIYNRNVNPIDKISNRANNTSIQLLDSNKKVIRTIFTGNWYSIFSKEYIL